MNEKYHLLFRHQCCNHKNVSYDKFININIVMKGTYLRTAEAPQAWTNRIANNNQMFFDTPHITVPIIYIIKEAK